MIEGSQERKHDRRHAIIPLWLSTRPVARNAHATLFPLSSLRFFFRTFPSAWAAGRLERDRRPGAHRHEYQIMDLAWKLGGTRLRGPSPLTRWSSDINTNDDETDVCTKTFEMSWLATKGGSLLPRWQVPFARRHWDHGDGSSTAETELSTIPVALDNTRPSRFNVAALKTSWSHPQHRASICT